MDELSEELDSSLSPEELRDRLLTKVKDCNAEISMMEKTRLEWEEKLEMCGPSNQPSCSVYRMLSWHFGFLSRLVA